MGQRQPVWDSCGLDILLIISRYFLYRSSMENLAGWGDFTSPPQRGQLSSWRVYVPHFVHRLRSQTMGLST